MSASGRGSSTATGYTPEELSRLHEVANLLDDEPVWTFVVDALIESRDRAARHPDDRDSGDLLDDVIAALRNTH
jgi:hypothetical protein